MTPKVWDCVMLHDELDMLEVRLRDTGLAHRTVIVESPVTHRGDPKPLHYQDNAARFAPWRDRITHVVADLPESDNPWVREHAQRDAALSALQDADDTDLVLIADVDEIPSRAALRARPETASALSMRMAMYAVDWVYPENHLCSVLAPLGEVRQSSLSAVRDRRYEMPVIEDGGWHLTWLGGVAAQRRKLDRDCHTDRTGYESSLIRKGRCYREGIHHSGKIRMIPAEVDETWPRMIYQQMCPPEWFRPR